jgi:hypothetical protein
MVVHELVRALFIIYVSSLVWYVCICGWTTYLSTCVLWSVVRLVFKKEKKQLPPKQTIKTPPKHEKQHENQQQAQMGFDSPFKKVSRPGPQNGTQAQSLQSLHQPMAPSPFIHPFTHSSSPSFTHSSIHPSAPLYRRLPPPSNTPVHPFIHPSTTPQHQNRAAPRSKTTTWPSSPLSSAGGSTQASPRA